MYLNLIKHLQFEMEEVTCYGPLNQVVPSSSLICLQTSIVVLDGNKGRLHQSPFFFPMASQQRGARSWSPWAMAQNSEVHKLWPGFSEPLGNMRLLDSLAQEFITRLKLCMKPCWVRVNCAYWSSLTSTSSSSRGPPSLLYIPFLLNGKLTLT